MAKPRKPAFRCLCIGTAILCVCLIISLAVLLGVFFRGSCNAGDNVIDVSEPDTPGVFNDLTQKELRALTDYMYSLQRFNLLKPPVYAVNRSHIFAAHLYPPPKDEVIDHLDNGGPQPARKAKVVLFRGDLIPPVVEEYIVGPLPNPSSCDLLVSSTRKNPIPFENRPYNIPEWMTFGDTIYKEIDDNIGYILLESYGATFQKCDTKCLRVYPSSFQHGSDRRIWLRSMQNREFYTLHPVDFEFLADLTAVDPSSYKVDKVFYSGRMYSSLKELARLYNTSTIPKTRIPFPELNNDLFSTMNLRGDPVPSAPQSPPRLFEPDGRRFSIQHGRVSYMQWQFQIGMHVFFGPRMFDVRFNGDRIAYEVSLQEMAVFYSGPSPGLWKSTFLDSVGNIGTTSTNLNLGYDCPRSAVKVDAYVLNEASSDPRRLESAFCVFEQNTGAPMKRHLAVPPSPIYYSGAENSALVVRSIHTIANYDYIIDFIYHQTGAMETRVMSTGYIASTFNIPGETEYGFQLHDHVIGSIHQHLFHFKVDLDVQGTSNRYQTLDISAQPVDADAATGVPEDIWQIKQQSNVRDSEQEALYSFNFDAPKYHLIYNEGKKSKYGNPRAYRIHSYGLHKQLLPVKTGNEESISWTRHQMAFTKVKDDERESSSVYGIGDLGDPVVNFTSFYSDDDILLDEDIVAWLTLGLYHIPHTEDLPVTSTVGGHLGFFLLPYNYFNECPSVSSRDAVRIDPVDQSDISKGFIFKNYEQDYEKTCVP